MRPPSLAQPVGIIQLIVSSVRVREGTGDGDEAGVTRLPHYAAMRAMAGTLPGDGDRWGYEVEFDGILL